MYKLVPPYKLGSTQDLIDKPLEIYFLPVDGGNELVSGVYTFNQSRPGRKLFSDPIILQYQGAPFGAILFITTEVAGKISNVFRAYRLEKSVTINNVTYTHAMAASEYVVMYEKTNEPFSFEVAPNDFLFLEKILPWHTNGQVYKYRSFELMLRKLLDPEFKVNDSHRMIYNSKVRGLPFSFKSATEIGDCGFGSIYPIVKETDLPMTSPQYKYDLICLFASIEYMLSRVGYIIFTPPGMANSLLVDKPTNPTELLFTIAKYSDTCTPISNPNSSDHQSRRGSWLTPVASRNRYLCAITHTGLARFYQSPEYNALKKYLNEPQEAVRK